MRLIIGDIDLNDDRNGWTIQPELEGFAGLPPLRITDGQNAGQDGGWSTTPFYDARSLNIKGTIFAQTVTELEEKRRQLTQLAGNRQQMMLTWVTDDGRSYSILAKTTALTMGVTSTKTIQPYQLVMRADDPTWYSSAGAGGAVVATLRRYQEGGGFTIPFKIPLAISPDTPDSPISNSGSTAVYPIITITGIAHSPKILNLTTNQYIEVMVDTKDGDTLIIDCSPTRHTVTINGGNVYHGITAGSQFIHLDPGDNKLRLITKLDSDTAVAKIRYNSGYIGV